MGLPKFEIPTYETILPSTGKKIKFRPFLVKEEKTLIICLQEQTMSALLQGVKEIVSACTFDNVDVNKMTSYDLEWLFLQIRIKSKGGIVNLRFKCKNEIMDGDTSKECGNIIEFEYNLENIKISNTKTENNIILDESRNIGVILKYPTYDITEKIISMENEDVTSDSDILGNIIYDFVECIFEGDTVHDDFSKDDFSQWIETLNTDQFKKIKDFFQNIPKIQDTIKIKCPKCGNEQEITIKGLSNFLA